MKYMLIMRCTKGSPMDAWQGDVEAALHAMGRYNESMIEAGVLLDADGLAPADEGFVVDFDGPELMITDGPYGEVHELFNGFWIIEASSREEAVVWASRAPLGPGMKLEVRRITDETDFAAFADNEFIQKEKEWRSRA